MHHQNDLTTTLSKKDKGASEVRSVLARLTRTILKDLNITPAKFIVLMKGYLANPINGIAQNTKDRSSAQGNLTKAIVRDQLTWKTFEKLLILLKVVGFRITVELLRHGETKWSTHKLKFDNFGAGYDDLPTDSIDLVEALDLKTKLPTRTFYLQSKTNSMSVITDDMEEFVELTGFKDPAALDAALDKLLDGHTVDTNLWSIRCSPDFE